MKTKWAMKAGYLRAGKTETEKTGMRYVKTGNV